MSSKRVPGFLPSTNGLHFANEFSPEPLVRLGLGRVAIPIGNTSNGLCGGMVFTVRDLFEHRLPPPTDRFPPRSGTRLFDYLLRRLFASFNLPTGPLRYWLWQALPAGDWGILRGVAWRTVRRHWPRIRADLDRGRLVPIGLVRARSLSPLQLGQNHQVLAYGYDLDEETAALSIRVYDPNHPDDDGCSLSLSVSAPTRATPITYVSAELPVRGFFRTTYRRHDPSAIAGVL